MKTQTADFFSNYKKYLVSVYQDLGLSIHILSSLQNASLSYTVSVVDVFYIRLMELKLICQRS